ncbi:ABC transporter permease [Actinomarinicola tropica]|uniref:Transport permease protein n=1 Tax=Actinomarinicola tropica TaxID=2789776 RepID=A0A5Q2RLK6_9ACTN|nr:ABC transporter permease [Actinomarinicola tropica]QGG96723.1 ABC transporter permease [Actinomarinicola tropica]
MSALLAQTRTELRLNLRNGEQLLLTLGIPVLLLVFFSLVEVLPLPDDVAEPIDFLAPGVLALAVLSTAFTGLAIATGFDRQYGVLKRLGATPLGRGRLLAAKTATVVVIELVQVAVLVPVALLLGWEPSIDPLTVLAAVVLATIAFAGVAMLMAGTLPGLVVLAAANGIYVLLLLVGDLVIPLDELPGALRSAAQLLPTAAFAELLRAGLGDGEATAPAWIVLGAWAVAAPVVAARAFRWE